jgi:6-phosphogluconolactonase
MTIDRSGELSIDSLTESLNPAVLIPHADGKHLYAILETIQDEGTIERYSIQADGSLVLDDDDFKASGRSTCYLALSPQKDAAIVINYWDAIIDVCSVDSDGKLGAIHQSFKQYYRLESDWRQVQSREDHWGNRQ